MREAVKLEKGADEKFCSECGEIIRAKAEICPKCGVRQFAAPTSAPPPAAPAPITNGRTKTTAGLLAIFLGGLGVHKFYLGRNIQGVFYLLFCWTFIPAIFGFLEGIVYFSMSDQAFAEKYGMALRTTEARPLVAKPHRPPHDLHNDVEYKMGRAVSRAVNRYPLLKFSVWGLGIFIGLYVLGSVVKQMRESSPASDVSSTVTASIDASNGADLLIARCGQPSSDDSSAYDNPRPPIPARIIEYKEQRLRFMFIPGGDTHVGDAPPYQWKLAGITDMTAADPSQAAVVAPSEAVVRMPCWSGK
jgi:TM2 domain-containing membrane protein YozV